jgi:hypothetical protein
VPREDEIIVEAHNAGSVHKLTEGLGYKVLEKGWSIAEATSMRRYSKWPY